jgi:hypothetical protein
MTAVFLGVEQGHLVKRRYSANLTLPAEARKLLRAGKRAKQSLRNVISRRLLVQHLDRTAYAL